MTKLARVRILGLRPIPWTLQRYIFREMGKTFLLTSLAMTAIVALGGGVLRMVEMSDVTNEQLLRLIGLVLPISLVMTIPVAALFSAASTYGRFSADNEFVACRSSGINMHELFLPPVVLSVFSAAVTFTCTNFVIPDMVQSLDEFIAADFPALIQQRLNRPGGVRMGPGRKFHADRAVVDPDNPDRVILEGVAYIEATELDWLRFGTAQQVVLEVDRAAEAPVVGGAMFDVTYLDRDKGQFVDLGQQRFPPNELGELTRRRLHFLELKELIYFRRHLDEWSEVRRAIEKLRLQVGARRLFDSLTEQWVSGGNRLTLSDDQCTLSISGASAIRFGDGSGMQLTDVVIVEQRGGRGRTCRAARADIEIARGDTLSDSGLRVEVYDARIEAGEQTIERERETFDPVILPKSAVAEVLAIPVSELLERDPSIGNAHPIEKRRQRAASVRGETSRRIDAIISQRFAYSVSTFVLVIFAAVLGILLRGSHAIVSFGISFVPALVVLLTIIMGRQMTQNDGTYVAGLLLMWSGIALVALLDVWTLTRVVRR